MALIRTLVGAMSALACVPAALAGDVQVFSAGSFQTSVPVKSFKEKLFDEIIRQQYDFSCGSAALATLLYYHYYRDVTEKTVMKSMYETGDQQKILKEGFSLLDMKRYLASIGLDADGYRVPLEKLEGVGVPSIALINHNGYLHFVVIKGVYENEVLLGDPALGIRKMKRPEFEAMWNGVAFVIKSELADARGTFNVADSWHIRPSADLGQALSREALSTFTVHISPTPGYIGL